MDTQRAALLQVVLEGVPLPATRAALIDYASQEDPSVVDELRRLPDREYQRLDEVGEELLGPRLAPRPEARLPKPESGAPPGGGAYTDEGTKDAETGFVRPDAPPGNPPSKALEQQSKTQKRQQAAQSS
jgi:hypothetical protein